MAYKWQENSEGSGGPTLPKGGPHRCRIVKVETTDRDGRQLLTDKGDVQIILVLQNQEAQEARMWLTCSDRAGWVLAKLLGCFNPPANLARLEADGVEPINFANQQFADANLLNREVYIVMEEHSYNNKTTLKPMPVKPPAGAPAAPPPPPPAAPIAPPPPPPPPPVAVVANNADEAWVHFYNKWPSGSEARAGEAWIAAIHNMGKPQEQFTAADWTAIANQAPVPF